MVYRLSSRRLLDISLDTITRISFRDQESALTVEAADRHPFPAHPSQPSQVSITAADLTWNVVFPKESPANPEAVASLLAFVREWQALDMVEESAGTRSSLARFGMIHPACELTLGVDRNRTPITVSVGRDAEAGRWFVKTSLSMRIWEISGNDYARLQDFINLITSRKIFTSLDQAARIELSSPLWNLIMIPTAEGIETKILWPQPAAGPLAASRPLETRTATGGDILELLRRVDYVDRLTGDEIYLYPEYPYARPVFRLAFYDRTGVIRDKYTVKQHPGQDTTSLFVEHENAGEVYFTRDFFPAILLPLIASEAVPTPTAIRPPDTPLKKIRLPADEGLTF